MALSTFTWCPRINSGADTHFRVRRAKFGDGYEQVSGDGLNPRSQEWSVSFVGGEEYIKAIKTFLDDHGGIKAFLWKPPLEEIGLYRCEAYKPTALGNRIYNLDATFIQAFKA